MGNGQLASQALAARFIIDGGSEAALVRIGLIANIGNLHELGKRIRLLGLNGAFGAVSSMGACGNLGFGLDRDRHRDIVGDEDGSLKSVRNGLPGGAVSDFCQGKGGRKESNGRHHGNHNTIGHSFSGLCGGSADEVRTASRCGHAVLRSAPRLRVCVGKPP